MALMYSVMLYSNASFVLLLLCFEFLASVNLLVYVGALAVLFLFVIMLLEIPATELRSFHRGWSLLCSAGGYASRVLFLPWPFHSFAVSQALHPASGTGISLFLNTASHSVESLSSLGHAFFLRSADLLVLNSLVLTVALFGTLIAASAPAR
jgi:NADH:ubiquinone oxidoreductase subunit 6 (subunit J)